MFLHMLMSVPSASTFIHTHNTTSPFTLRFLFSPKERDCMCFFSPHCSCAFSDDTFGTNVVYIFLSLASLSAWKRIKRIFRRSSSSYFLFTCFSNSKAMNMAILFCDFSYFMFTDVINMDGTVTGALLRNPPV